MHHNSTIMNIYALCCYTELFDPRCLGHAPKIRKLLVGAALVELRDLVQHLVQPKKAQIYLP